jgi:SAM-dependent methyltransferase
MMMPQAAWMPERDHHKMSEPYCAPDAFAAGLFPVSPITHDHGIRLLFDLATLLLLLDCRPGDRVLDLGAGSGFSSEMLARLGYDVFPLDPDLTALQHNRRRPSFDAQRIQGRVSVAQGVAQQLPFADASFDGIFAMNVLHHVEDLDTVVSEFRRVLRPGGRMVASEPGLDHLTMAHTKRAMQEFGENDRAFDVIEFLRLARAHGFDEAMLSATLHPPLRLVRLEEIDLYRNGEGPRQWLTPQGVLRELHYHHSFAMLVNPGTRPKTSRHPGRLEAQLEVAGVPAAVGAGQVIAPTIGVTNAGDTIWLAKPSALGGYVTLGCKVLTTEGRLITDGVGRTCLPRDVQPGERVSVTTTLALPDTLGPGTYVLEFDMVNELICWFSDSGISHTARTNVVVS